VTGLNPFDLRNIDIDEIYMNYLAEKAGVARERPIIFQMGRFTLIKGFYLTMNAYVQMKKKWNPEAGNLPQLVFAFPIEEGALEGDQTFDPLFGFRNYLLQSGMIKEGDIVFIPLILPKKDLMPDPERIAQARALLSRLAVKHAGKPEVNLNEIADHLQAGDFASRQALNYLEVNALQRMADIGVHVSIVEAFGMVITEMLWKGKPIFASYDGGIPQQYPEELRTDFLIDVNGPYKKLLRTIEKEFVEGRYDRLPGILTSHHVTDPSIELAEKMLKFFSLGKSQKERFGKSFHEHVRQKFLLPNSILRHFQLLKSINRSELRQPDALQSDEPAGASLGKANIEMMQDQAA